MTGKSTAVRNRKSQTRRRRTLAVESLAIDVPSTADVHNTEHLFVAKHTMKS